MRQLISLAEKHSNVVMMKVILESGGIDRVQLNNVIALKNALVEEIGNERPTKDFISNVYEQLTALAGSQNEMNKQIEREDSRQRFCRRQGIRVNG